MPIVSFVGTHPIFSHLHEVPYCGRRAQLEETPHMTTRFHQINNLGTLREYVNETFCNEYELKSGAFTMTERVLLRGGKPCGIFFCLHGPRSVKFSAIWETDHNQILFYDSNGERFHRTQLLEAPRLARAAA